MNDRCIHCGAIYGNQHWDGCRVLLESNIKSLQSERDRLRDALKDLTYPYEPPETIGDAVLIIDHMRLRATKALEK